MRELDGGMVDADGAAELRCTRQHIACGALRGNFQVARQQRHARLEPPDVQVRHRLHPRDLLKPTGSSETVLLNHFY